MTKQDNVSIRVLLVDDEADLVEFLSHRLLKKGLTVTATTSGTAAMAAVECQRFDVVILDLKMPEMDGIEVLRRIKEKQPFLEAIMLTGHGSHESALEAGKLAAFRYLLKPYDFDELLTLIREAHARKRQAMVDQFRQELEDVISSGGSPREITAATERLRREYEQN